MLAVALMLGCDEAPDGPRAEPPLGVVASPAREASAYVGVVVARRSVELSAEVAGVVRADRALGTEVAAGDELGRIDGPTGSADLAVARAALASALAAEGLAAVEVGHAEREAELLTGLVAAGVGAPALGDRASLELERARADQRRAQATSAERRAEVDRAVAWQAAGHLVAPFAGSVAAWHVGDGERVEVGAPVVRLTGVADLDVRFAVPPEEAGALEGRRVRVVPLPSGAPLPAVVVRVAPELDPTSQRVFVEAALIGTQPAVVAGQACEVRWP